MKKRENKTEIWGIAVRERLKQESEVGRELGKQRNPGQMYTRKSLDNCQKW